MFEEILKFARKAQFYQGDINALGQMLPDSTQQLADLMQQVINELDEQSFTNIWMAAHRQGREVPGSLFANGAQLLENSLLICGTAELCARFESEEKQNLGDTTTALLAAVDSARMGEVREMVSLVEALRCWKIACGDESKLPEKIGLIARQKAREYFTFGLDRAEDSSRQMLLNVLAHLLDDERMKDDLREKQFLITDVKRIEKYIKNTLVVDLEKLLPERKPDRVISGYQVRRAVPKVGRNDDCHCGSGKKYKKCCFAEDQKKLSRSSEVEGITIDELEDMKEERLTVEEVRKMRVFEVMRLAPERLNESVLLAIGRQLMRFEEFDYIFKIYEATPHKDSPAWNVIFSDILIPLTRDKRVDLINRVLEIKPDEANGSYQADIQFARATGNPSAFIELLESSCREILKLEEEEKEQNLPRQIGAFKIPRRDPSSLDWVGLTFSLLESDFPHLGISFARGVLPIAGLDTDLLIERVELTRDQNGLDPVDLSEDFLQLGENFDSKQMIEAMEHRLDEKHSQKLLEQSRKLQAKEDEYRNLKESLVKSQQETARVEKQAREKLAELESLALKNRDTSISKDNPEIRKLQDQINQLKAEVKDKHNQRNELRRELRSSRTNLEEQSRKTAQDNDAAEEEKEEKLLEPEAYTPNAIARIPVFPENFLEDKRMLPDVIVSSAIKLIGRLASGEEAAFHGTKRLKKKREFLRQKVGSSYRIIFKIHERKLEVIDLINRRDLEKWLG